jgi:hypothetical protein
MVKNRNKGISNLMLYLCIASAVLFLYTYFTENYMVYAALRFDLEAIYRGQVWRCITWLITGCVDSGYGLLSVVFYILFNKWLGEVLEAVWGTLRMNVYYLGGALLTVVAAVLLGLAGIPVHISVYYLNISLMLAVATLIPEERIMLFGIFPLKMRWLAVLDVALIVIDFLRALAPLGGPARWFVFLMIGTAPLMSLVNYVLNFGKDVKNLLPVHRSFAQQKRHREFKKAAQPNPNWASNYRGKGGEKPYRHKCTVCGRTDTENPNLEFRYCSRCKGYFCYCIDHINNHTHIE